MSLLLHSAWRAIGHGRRELLTVPPYLIRYRIKDGTVEILAIRHGARIRIAAAAIPPRFPTTAAKP